MPDYEARIAFAVGVVLGSLTTQVVGPVFTIGMGLLYSGFICCVMLVKVLKATDADGA